MRLPSSPMSVEAVGQVLVQPALEDLLDVGVREARVQLVREALGRLVALPVDAVHRLA